MNKKTKEITLADVRRKLKGVPSASRAAVVCALIGHSKIVTAFFGYINCGRCGAQIADKLGGGGYANAEKCVQVGHNCATCRKNYKAMDWHDKFLVADPFAKPRKAGTGATP